jgi:AbrB family looped-hinge helix DNA binding protein
MSLKKERVAAEVERPIRPPFLEDPGKVLGMRKPMTTTVSSKGQVTIPAAVLRELRLSPGDTLWVTRVEEGVFMSKMPESIADCLEGSMRGVFGDATEYVSEERAAW